MRWDRSTILVLALLLANATAVLYFRFFITVDGPMHVLHASVLEAHRATPRYMAEGITYDADGLGTKFGDVLIMALLRLSTPEQAHDIFAALVCCVLVFSLAIFLRANGTRINAALLWLAPVSFSFLLIMGFFHFLLGVAVGFGVAAWWKWKAGSPYARWSGLVTGLFLAWCTHRSAPVFLCALILLLFAAELAEKRMASAPGRPRSLFWPSVIAGVLLLLGLLMLGHLLRGTTL
ncbi:MAG TPA: hypothetical protein VKG92_08330, partial [Flavobacteriales bacterium]|nr:hypothetical protein [Flavobacteriales bacterium]